MSHNPMFAKLVAKKKSEGKEVSEVGKKAKGNILKELEDQMGSMMGESLKGIKKVSVSSNSEDGLKAGLKKAEEIVENKAEGGDIDESVEAEDRLVDSEGAEHEEDESEEDSVDEMKKKIAELEAKLASMKA